MTAQEAFERMVAEDVWPFLRARGFKRAKATFHRAVGPNWQVVNLQKSAWSDREALRFAVNLGVARDELRRSGHDWAEGKRPSESACHFRARLGTVMHGEDIWWDVDPHTDTAALGDALTEAIERYGFPWLDARSTDEGVIALMRDETARRAEHTFHLGQFDRLLEQLGRDDLRPPVAAEVERQSAEIERRRRLEDDA